MSKTKPIGIRFDENMLPNFKEEGIAETYQQAFNFIYGFYLQNKNNESNDKLAAIQFMPNTPTIAKIETPKISERTVWDDNDNEIVDYQKLFNECEFDEERKILWERIKIDVVLNEREKKTWKLRLGIR